ncbi:MAG: hypothetical protein A2568_00915 [Candidatus Yanofskybacteria bacterium RIFOXYD1_FULL_44_17]|nr:MAG: hypothetical protein A2207_01965 [Candidatus Yanofskybacteria bacterium RIFOXYA1_FULL_44_17]OGN36810.1 MAG: hypothetical protein A2241_03410 [Candidatus Yanofskybacteria bacterium RIFOXYA2_FULL_45_28]OGN38127.1 MAG: hypothetical protein A2371_01750 [Candidatus Yanofskybacteria bacterium RIFOXYB1_FULL_44_29]OGN38912.1 MAG: hypothetical protein A2302_01180 [Candidatus Yanofskybacteria bacterium RIFOXYB2_FULL_44_18]OGN39103.1 MAG: hypothetical protein A2405_02270 [Candidatus Yanofskybacter
MIEAIELLRAEARLLLQWARESEDGGWSTYQVEPMRRRARFLIGKAEELARVNIRLSGD